MIFRLVVEEKVTNFSFSPNNRYFIAALMDTTVKIFFMDSCQVRMFFVCLFNWCLFDLYI